MNTIPSVRQLLSAAVVSVSLVSSVSAIAQAAPARIRATINKISGDSVDVTDIGGKNMTLKLAPDVGFLSVDNAAITDIKADSFIGTAAIPLPDGTLKALEVTVFPPGMKPAEGHYQWDLGSDSSMTNGTVGDVVIAKGRTITVKYKNGEQKILVPENAPIVRLAPADHSLLVVGAHAIFFMSKAADGSPVAARAAIGRGGVVPPM
ncbi:hypothetical protein [Undibacterium sp.]|uniref:hypothetical protein n=1 Tax=Undibacterium sp. TaxID=1914977 RepID=UPI00374C8D43